jgi:hypothetical protein
MTGATGGVNAPHLATVAKNYLNTQFATWAEAWVGEHPDVAGLYNKAVRPGLTTILDNSAIPAPQQVAGTTTPAALPQTAGV